MKPSHQEMKIDKIQSGSFQSVSTDKRRNLKSTYNSSFVTKRSLKSNYSEVDQKRDSLTEEKALSWTCRAKLKGKKYELFICKEHTCGSYTSQLSKLLKFCIINIKKKSRFYSVSVKIEALILLTQTIPFLLCTLSMCSLSSKDYILIHKILKFMQKDKPKNI